MTLKTIILALGFAQSTSIEVHARAGHLDAPVAAPHQRMLNDMVKDSTAPKKKVDLADVMVQAVDLMDAGILEFLKEESTSKHVSANQKSPDDFARLVKSQHKAMAVVRQLSTNFGALKDVAKKLKKRGGSHAGSAVAKEVQEMKEERASLQAAVHQLDARAQSCEDSLNTARVSVQKWQAAVSNCSSRISDEAAREVSQKAVADVKKIRKAEDAEAEATSEMDMLRKENQEMTQKMRDYEQRIAAFEGKGSISSAMSKEAQECKQEKKSLQEDKEGLVKTVQHLLKANGTETLTQQLQKEVMSLQRAQLETQKVYGNKIQKLQDQLKSAQDNAADVKEVAQTVNEQNSELTKNNGKLQGKLESCEADKKDLEDDKKQLVLSLQGTLRQNTEYQAQMAKEEIKRADHPKKPQPAQKKSQAVANVLKGPGTSKDDEIKVMGETRAIDHYIASTTVEQPAQDIVAMPVPVEKAPAQEKAEPKQTMPSTGPAKSKLSEYLTQDRESPPVKKELTPEQKAEEQAKKEAAADDNIGNDVGHLLSQAEDAVNQAQIDDSDSDSTADEDASDAQTLSDAAVLLQTEK